MFVMKYLSLIAFFLFQLGEVLSLRLINFGLHRSRLTRQLQDIPLELTGQLDASRSWDVKFIFNGEEKIVKIKEDTSVLDCAEKVFKGVESSCRNGVCTTCAGQVLEGKENKVLAVHGLGQPQLDAGFVCTCQCYVTGPGVVIKLATYDECYESQYGQFEKSYEMKFAKREDEPQKKKGLFGF